MDVDGTPSGRAVVVAGGYRTGSTLQYNLLGVYVETLGVGKRGGWIDPDDAERAVEAWRADRSGIVIAKCHHVVRGFRHYSDPEAWADLVHRNLAIAVGTIRHEPDVRRSMCRKFGILPEHLEQSLEWREDQANRRRWRQIGIFEQSYEQLVRRPVDALRGLTSMLDLEWSADAASAAAESTSLTPMRKHIENIATGTWDPVSLLHWDHIAPETAESA